MACMLSTTSCLAYCELQLRLLVGQPLVIQLLQAVIHHLSSHAIYCDDKADDLII